jgi:hypothetical protein
MRAQLIAGGLIGAALLSATSAAAHTVTPREQTVRTLDERGVAYFSMVNGRKGVSQFEVEIFDADWTRSLHATPIQPLIVAPPSLGEDGDLETGARPFSVMIDLGGAPSRSFFVCTKSVLPRGTSKRAMVNTRVCGKLTMERY